MMHRLLARQIGSHLGCLENMPDSWRKFIEAVDQAYAAFDEDRALAERSLQLASDELVDRNSRLRCEIERLERLDADLQQSLSVLKATLESTADGILVVGNDGKVVIWNQKFLLMWRLPEGLLESRDVLDARRLIMDQVKDAGGFEERLEEIYADKEGDSQDEIELKDGRVFERYSHPQKIGGVCVGRVWNFRDVTARRRMQASLLQSEKMSAVGQLAAGVAHEINNPLGVILGFSQGLVRRLPPGDALEIPLTSIEREAKRCKDLVQDLLTFSRASKTDQEPLDLNQALESAFSLIQARAKVRRVEVVKELSPDLPRAQANRGQIQQVAVNLANNALDAMPPEGGRIFISTELCREKDRSWVCLAVRDTGTGIPKEVLPRIFEPFFTTKPVGKGTGLGLSLVYEIVKKHSGTITVESRPGRTEFRVKLPVRTGREIEDRLAADRRKIAARAKPPK